MGLQVELLDWISINLYPLSNFDGANHALKDEVNVVADLVLD